MVSLSPVLVERSIDPGWLSNAYLVAEEPGGAAVFVDSGAPLESLFEKVERERLNVLALLTTHRHHDHISGDDELLERFGCEIVSYPTHGRRSIGPFEVEALRTPGHSDDGLAFVVDGACFTGDTLFRDSVGGGDLAQIRRSVMEVLMKLPPETRVLPGHTDETTIGREWEENPFVRVWRGIEPEGTDTCRVAGRSATLIVWSPDYDGGGKAWVRFDDGVDAIVGGSRIER
jgi:glyoxylase-like metal-dependent hydrolase (beta-lactamase superfamily II)